MNGITSNLTFYCFTISDIYPVLQFFLPLKPMKVHMFYRSGFHLENYAVAEFRSHSEAVEAMEKDMQTLSESQL